jgi:outer membrane protein assembly factor BamD
MAKQYYEDEKYFKAMPIFDELRTLYRGTAKAEEVDYYMAYTHYGVGENLLSAYHFRTFVQNFPNSKYVEEAAYMNAYCHYLESPSYSLDAASTEKAIEELQYFIDQFPASERVQKCNGLIDELRTKLEKKAFEIAKLYYDTEDYKSAIVSLNNVVRDFPGTAYSEEIYFLILDANHLLASNSVTSKQKERWSNTITAYHYFIDNFGSSSKIKDAEDIYKRANKQLEKL